MSLSEVSNLEKKSKLRSTVPFKLKDKNERNWKAFNLKTQFGFIPEVIIISKFPRKNNIIILSAVVPPETK
jgi:hypothetical protein